jgi:hypothetical protein
VSRGGAAARDTRRSVDSGKAPIQRPVIAFEIPPSAESPFIFRRDFLAAIRSAISSAQIAGTIDTAVAVACFKALPVVAEPATA